MNIAVCEDNKLENDMLCELLKEEASRFGLNCGIFSFDSGDGFLKALERDEKIEYLILDIYMQGRNGILTAMKARERNPDIQIAFLTVFRDFALDAYQLNALHYLIKPITVEKVRELLCRYQQRTGKRELKMLKIRSQLEEFEFPLNRIEKLVSTDKKCDLYIEGRKSPIRIPLTFSDAEMQMQEDCFLKISRGLLVHMDFITRMTANECFLKDGTATLLSRGQREQIREKYRYYCQQQLSKASISDTALQKHLHTL